MSAIVKVAFYDGIDDSLLKFAVIVAKSDGRWIFCKHKDRDTYEVLDISSNTAEAYSRSVEERVRLLSINCR